LRLRSFFTVYLQSFCQVILVPSQFHHKYLLWPFRPRSRKLASSTAYSRASRWPASDLGYWQHGDNLRVPVNVGQAENGNARAFPTSHIALKWAPDETQFTQMNLMLSPPPGADPLPDLVTAFREQLGMKLESTKAPVDVIVIDKVSRPSEN
jgi:hypothetical protein